MIRQFGRYWDRRPLNGEGPGDDHQDRREDHQDRREDQDFREDHQGGREDQDHQDHQDDHQDHHDQDDRVRSSVIRNLDHP